MDFIRVASLSAGGEPIIALPSVTKKGISRIVPTLERGGVTTRGRVQWVVTEHGAVKEGRSRSGRLLIGIAAPEHRESLERAYREGVEG